MIDEVRLARLSQLDAESRLKNSRLAVMAPWSVEQRGPHLPLGRDAFAADTLAEEVSRKMDTLPIPLRLVGVSPYHLNGASSLSLQSQAMIALTEDSCECLANHGVDKVLFAAVPNFPESEIAKKIMGDG